MEQNNSAPRLGREPIPAGEVSGRVSIGQNNQEQPNQERSSAQQSNGRSDGFSEQTDRTQSRSGSFLSGQAKSFLKKQAVNSTANVITPHWESKEEEKEAKKDLSHIKNDKSVIKSRAKIGKYIPSPIMNAVEQRTMAAIKPIVDKLNNQIDRGHTIAPFIPAFGIAILKDVFDGLVGGLAGALGLTGIGIVGTIALWAIEFFLISLPFSIFLYLMMKNKGAFNGTKAKSVKVLYIILSFIDGTPVGFFPLQTVGVYIGWRQVKNKAIKAKETKEKLLNKYKKHMKMSHRELQKLRELSKYDEEEIIEQI